MATSNAAILYYGAVTDTGTALYSVDTATGAQAPVMTIEGVKLTSLASSPVPGALYGMERVQFNLGVYYECLHLIELRLQRDRMVGCGRMVADFLAFDPRRNVLYGSLAGLTTLDQRTAAAQPFLYYNLPLLRNNQGMTIAYDSGSDTLFGSAAAINTKGFYTIDRTTGTPTQIGASSYRALAVEPGSGVMYGIAPDLETQATPELRSVDKSSGAGTPVATLAGPGTIVGLAALPIESPAITLAEYHHAGFDHYFVTGDPAEIAKLDSGAIGGWLRTGELYTVFPLDSPGTSNTCRFFSTAFAPKSSHFFTSDAGECAIVKENPAWVFEGEVFAQIAAPPDGACAAGLASLYRLYNNGQGGAPAHRYAVRDAVRAQQLQQGWIAEGAGAGVVGCVVPGSWLPDSGSGVWIGTSANPAGGPTSAHEDVDMVMLDDGRFYQLYVDKFEIGPASIGAIVVGTASADRGTLTSTSARRFRFTFGPDGSMGSAADSALSASYTPESSLSGKATQEAAFGTAYQVGYRTRADLAAAVGTYTGAMGSMLIGSGSSEATLGIAANGAVAGAFGQCTYSGTLSPQASVNVFDFTIAFDKAACPTSTVSMTGVAYFDAAKRTLFAIAVNGAGTDAFGFSGRKP